jgi:hypothetical protein
MQFMRHDIHGWAHANGLEIIELKKNGWRESSHEEHAVEVAKKLKKHDNSHQSNDELEGTSALPSGEPLAKRRGRQKGA